MSYSAPWKYIVLLLFMLCMCEKTTTTTNHKQNGKYRWKKKRYRFLLFIANTHIYVSFLKKEIDKQSWMCFAFHSSHTLAETELNVILSRLQLYLEQALPKKKRKRDGKNTHFYIVFVFRQSASIAIFSHWKLLNATKRGVHGKNSFRNKNHKKRIILGSIHGSMLMYKNKAKYVAEENLNF